VLGALIQFPFKGMAPPFTFLGRHSRSLNKMNAAWVQVFWWCIFWAILLGSVLICCIIPCFVVARLNNTNKNTKQVAILSTGTQEIDYGRKKKKRVTGEPKDEAPKQVAMFSWGKQSIKYLDEESE